MKFRLLVLALGLVSLTGCSTVPMSYQEWREEQDRRRSAVTTGIPFKSKRQLLAEGTELQQIAAETRFP
ncbi:MAG TPA: hypothetical protein VEB66_12815 [Opitutaceae bacterium]|nr:hypothetical protein [Opitutaceae bacterium]